MKTASKFHTICVLGAGLWGGTLANHLARKGRVALWEFFPELARRLEKSRRHPHIPGLRLRPGVRVTSRLEEALAGAQLVVVAAPSRHVRSLARAARGWVASFGPAAAVNVSKGVEPLGLRTMGQVLDEEWPSLRGRVFTLSGPSFAREVARGVPTRLVLAGKPGALRRGIRKTFEGGPLQILESGDRLGAELGGSLKNVLAIGCGVLDGLGAGANTKAAFIAQGMNELARLGARLGAKAGTLYGPAGLGDLVATGTSNESRNRALGEKLGRGLSLSEALRRIPTVAEGAESARSARRLLKRAGLRAPALEAVCALLAGRRAPDAVVGAMGFTRFKDGV